MKDLDLYRGEDILKVVVALQFFIIEEMEDAHTDVFDEASKAKHSERAGKVRALLRDFEVIFNPYVE